MKKHGSIQNLLSQKRARDHKFFFVFLDSAINFVQNIFLRKNPDITFRLSGIFIGLSVIQEFFSPLHYFPPIFLHIFCLALIFQLSFCLARFFFTFPSPTALSNVRLLKEN